MFPEAPRPKHKCSSLPRDRGERADDPGCATCQSVPREYLVLDPKRVQSRVNGFGVDANIPGIEVWMEGQTSVRKKF